MLFALDEGVLDLLDIGEPSCLLDGIKRLVNHLHIPLIVVNQFNLLLIIQYQLRQPILQHRRRVILNRHHLSRFNSTSSIQFRILQLLVQLIQTLVVVGLVLLVFHLEAQHEVLVHFGVVLGGLNVLHQVGDLLVGGLDVDL